MTKFAITGNIAAGKSLVESILKEKGFEVYDTDKFAHQILENSAEVKEAFKDYDIISEGKICRKKLGTLVFNNHELKTKLEQIIHPKIKKIIEEINTSSHVFISVPLLFEANMQTLFDKTIFITADETIRLERLMKRNSLSKEEAILRINAQENEKNKLRNSDFIIYNNSDVNALKLQVENFLSKI